MIRTMMDNLILWDSTLCLRIFRWNGKPWLDRLMVFLTHLGNGYAYGLFALLVLVFDRSLAGRLIPAGLTAFAVELSMYKILKTRLKRPRPFRAIPEIRNLVKPPDEFSFPSGHTAAAFVMAALLSWHFPGLALPSFLTALSIGISRVYNGVHYPGDVLAGMVLGTASAGIGLMVFG